MDDIFQNLKVLIFGLGLNKGGVGSARFFASQGAKVRVTDLRSGEILKPSISELKDYPQIEYSLDGHKNEDINWADLIIKNPAVKPNNPYTEYAKKQGKRVEQDMGIFLNFVKPSQIIGVTGTKGKSTTTSLIYEVLEKGLSATRGLNVVNPRGWLASNPRKIVLGGNIGKSVLDIIPDITPDTLVVLELSSFQLESFEKHQVSPKWAVITNITPDHLNYYSGMNEYVAAKRIIGKYQEESDYLFLKKDDLITTQPDFLKDLKGQIIYFSKDDLPKTFHPHLKGEHNLENMAAALSVAKIFGISQAQTLDTIAKFKGVPFRMELIKTWKGVKIINDTTSTSPEAGIQAIKTASHIGSSPRSAGGAGGNVVLVCGGMNKGMDYTKYATIVGKLVKKVYFLEGDSTEEIKKNLSLVTSHLLPAKTYNDLEKLLTDVKKIVESGDTILFSPAATSFNLFQNEFDRGRKFNEAVQKVFK